MHPYSRVRAFRFVCCQCKKSSRVERLSGTTNQVGLILALQRPKWTYFPMIWNLRRNDHDHAPRILTECFNYSRFESLSCIGRKPIMSEEALFTGSAGQSVAIESRSRSRLGLVVTGLVGGSLVALYAVATPFVAPALRKICLPFVPATTTQVENVLNALRARSGTLVDIGSGDGRIVSAVMSCGCFWLKEKKKSLRYLED